MSPWLYILNGLLFLAFFLKLFNILTRSKLSQERGHSCPVYEEMDDLASGVDTITTLPRSIIENILSRLPLREMVRTSLLSREWKHRWLTCPELVFDVCFDQMFLKGRELNPIIHHVLRHHRGPLLRFTVQVPSLRSCPEIDEWLHLLPNDTLQDLFLRVSIGGEHRLTTHLFTFRHLRNLRLESCTFDPPLGFEGFNKLVTLQLQNVGLVPDRFGDFLASCSAIQTLILFHCTSFNCLEITGPRLKLFEFNGIFISISFKNCPLLRDVRLAFSPESNVENGFSFSLAESLSCLPALEELELQANALEGLFRYGAAPEKLAVALKSLKNLHLTNMYFEKIAEIASAISIIRSCPILQKLRITGYTYEAVDSVAGFLRSQEPLKCLARLKSIKMQLFCGNDSEMEFLKYMLSSAAALEEIAIAPHPGCITDGGEAILNELKQYPRASSRAEFISLDGHTRW
ncbi:F-box/FBD/LRR-repeat protein At1g13570-like isoform X1 [Salvia hispanica]|uniref:F-box/FBD/LRR-repeat protein At1g13570-like isoform X1 n=2 Tax=Salvia hispanica TaxID=49212 RepID=UPI002009D921|nr:F-box/FBD/LRR-repeat protein At1g13570-like isoform X1 [Salvia hispanica]